MKKAIVIGSGFSGLAVSALLAKEGFDVQVIEQHGIPGGRARKFEASGFTFDMGPSWYWMPEVFDRYFGLFGKKSSDFYQLQRLDPSYRVYWKDGMENIPADYNALVAMFERIEQGSSRSLEKFLKEAEYKYEVGINKLVHKPGRSITEFMDIDLARGVLRLDVFTSMKRHVKKHFNNPHLQQLMEFPVLFLGALAEHIPALYSLMNYADIKLGTWYPMGGMFKIVEAMHAVARERGVKFELNMGVTGFDIQDGEIRSVHVLKDGKADIISADVVIASADYHHIEQEVLPAAYRSYDEAYWEGRQMAPSCLLYYVGVSKRIPGLAHHSLFFDADYDRHAADLYARPDWPADPLFYVSATSVTDPTVAPAGHENLFFLIPVAAGLTGDDEALRDKYFEKILDRFEDKCGASIRGDIVYKRSFSISDFVHDYHAFKGNAYGLANTLKQTAIGKPAIRSRKLDNLYYTGQLTVPGPGVPPALISGEVVAIEITKAFTKKSKQVRA